MTDERSSSESVTEGIADALTRIFGEASPDTLFSQPTEAGDDLIITASAWERAGGFGFGTGEGRGEAGDVGTGQGGGGGGVSQGRPVAVIRVGPGGVEVTPVIDFTKIGVTLLLGVIGVWRALRR
jgi:uncharacterized spore protein YtfJ